MEEDPDEAAYLYLDGHVRVDHGNDANLPRRYVSRQKLCLRGTTDYWINDALGCPFFVISKAVTEGLTTTLLNEILPELLDSVPGQPTLEAFGIHPKPRFVTLHGPLNLIYESTTLDCAAFPAPISLAEPNLAKATAITTTSRLCLTVENEDTFHSFEQDQQGKPGTTGIFS